jgi:Cdc6-like AAA superfamily ATPase
MQEAAQAPPAPALASDDIDRAYADECSAIMLDFARRLAGARTGSERRAIKIARKSALAAAKEKRKLLKAARRAANIAARQNTPRRQPRAS